MSKEQETCAVWWCPHPRYWADTGLCGYWNHTANDLVAQQWLNKRAWEDENGR